jgi:hypothetical protein
MDRGNKLWESHRMMSPEMREIIQERKKEPIPKPLLSEDYLAELEQRIRYAQGFQKSLLITYYACDQIHELVAFSFRVLQDVVECNFENGRKRKIGFSEIIDVEII